MRQRVLPHIKILLFYLDYLLKRHYVLWQHLQDRLPRTVFLKTFLFLIRTASSFNQAVFLCFARVFLTCKDQALLQDHLDEFLCWWFLVLEKLKILFFCWYFDDFVRKKICSFHHPLEIIFHFEKLCFGTLFYHWVQFSYNIKVVVFFRVIWRHRHTIYSLFLRFGRFFKSRFLRVLGFCMWAPVSEMGREIDKWIFRVIKEILISFFSFLGLEKGLLFQIKFFLNNAFFLFWDHGFIEFAIEFNLRQVIKDNFLFLFMINSIDEWRVFEKVLGKGRLVVWRPDGLHTWKIKNKSNDFIINFKAYKNLLLWPVI